MTEGKRYPVLWSRDPRAELCETIPESVARKAYAAYEKKYGSQQSFGRIFERGGLSVEELDEFCPDWEEEEVIRLKNRIRELEEALMPFALFATAVKGEPWNSDVASRGHQHLVVNAFITALEVSCLTPKSDTDAAREGE